MNENEKVFTSAINPFALGEVVLNKKVDWDKLSDPQESLSEVLNVPTGELFSAESIMINPSLKIEGDNSIRLSKEESAERLTKYLNEKTKKRITLTKSISRRVALKNISPRVIENLFNMVEAPNDQAWKPANINWVDKGDYFEDVAELSDPIQGSLGDCYFISALCSVAWARPYAIVNATAPSAVGNEESPTHLVSFYNSKGNKEDVTISELTPVNASNNAWLYARSLDNGEIWPAIMEKAYAKWKTQNKTDFPDYTKIAGGDPVEACRQIIGGKSTYLYTSKNSESDIATFIRSNSLSMRTVNPMVAWTPSKEPQGCNYASAHIAANHAYSVLGWMYSNSQYYIVLRNPWGTYHGVLDTLSSTFSATTNKYFNANIKLNTNGVFAMKISTFKKYFYGLGVVK